MIVAFIGGVICFAIAIVNLIWFMQVREPLILVVVITGIIVGILLIGTSRK